MNARMLVALCALLAPGLAPPASAAPVPGEGGEREDWTWTWIDERGIALGGGGLDAEDVAYLADHGIEAILNYRGEYPQEEEWILDAGMDYLFLNNTYAEEDTMPLAHVLDAVAFIERMIEEGKPVYVHCTGGWHRSAAGVAAHMMKTQRLRAEDAWDKLARIRPGVEPRYLDALYEYEAYLFGQEKLTLDMWTDRWDVAPNETVNITAYVTHHGEPVEGVRVELKPDNHPESNVVATTGPDGRVNVTYEVRPSMGMQYIAMDARKEGFVTAYDRNLFWVKAPKFRPPTDVTYKAPDGPVEPGSEVEISVRVKELDKHYANARLTLTTPCATLWRDYTGWDGKDTITFRAPEHEGTHPLRLMVTRFPAQPVFLEIPLVVGEAGEWPGCDPKPQAPPIAPTDPTPTTKPTVEPTPPTPEAEPASGVDGRFAVPIASWAAPLAALVAVLLARRK